MNVKLPKGTEVICIHCDSLVYKLAVDVEKGDEIMAGAFDDVGFGRPKPGDQIVCPDCGEDLHESLMVMSA